MLASLIRHVLEAAEESADTVAAPAYLSRSETRAAEPALRRLAELLEQGAGNVRGVAMASVLLRDGASPLYERQEHSVAEDVCAAITVLEGER